MILDRFRLDGKVALVTGAGGGLGRAIAVAFAEAGADVALAGRTRSTLEETAGLVREAGRRARVAETDVSRAAQVEAMVGETLRVLGRLDILVNAAGVFNGDPLVDLREEDWRRVIDINLTGVFLCCKAVGPHMLERGSGKVINIATFLGERGQRANRAAYNASKAGVVALTRALSLEWAPRGVRVNCISPGAHRTPMTAPALSDPKAGRWLAEKTPLGRVGEPQDVTGVALLLASDASDYITGTNIFEDGGGWM